MPNTDLLRITANQRQTPRRTNRAIGTSNRTIADCKQKRREIGQGISLGDDYVDPVQKGHGSQGGKDIGDFDV